jgi:hypothetical protein
VSCCGTAVRSGTVGMVRCVEVSSNGGVVVMGIVRVTTLHPHEMGKSELPSPLEALSSSRMVCGDGDLL